MDPQQYEEICRYVRDGKIPQNKDQGKLKRKFLAMCRRFRWKETALYRKTRTKEVKILQRYQIVPLLYTLHEGPTGAYNGTERIFQQVQERYYWPKMYEDIRGYVQTCDACQRRGNPKANNILHPIKPKAPFQRIRIDIVGPLTITKKGNRYIVTAMDYFTKWLIAKAIKEAIAKTVSKIIYEKIICEHGCPQVLQSDRKTYFINRVIQDLSEKFRIKYRLSTPYHPQTNGLIECYNQTFCEKLAKMAEETTMWDKFIDPALIAYRMTKHATTGVTPFLLVYGREAVLLIDELYDLHIRDRMMQIMEEVPHIREEARRMIRHSQQRMIENNLKKEKLFYIGEEVLYHDAVKEKQYSGKLEEKWKGPYTINIILLNRSYKIADQYGVLRTLVNGDHLKKYDQRELELIVVIEVTEKLK